MPRRKRMYLPDYPYHIVQRGNNREACFIERENYQFYIELWKECAKRYGIAVHAYCLMTNHIHFLVTIKDPPLIKKEDAFAVLQKAVDFDPAIRRVTLGKPRFDEHSKKKAMGASEITLIEHSIFIEGLLRVLTGTVAPIEFLRWLSAPGVSEFERLGGTATFEITRG